MKVGLSMDDTPCQAKFIVGVIQIATRLSWILPHAFVDNVSSVKIRCSLLSCVSSSIDKVLDCYHSLLNAFWTNNYLLILHIVTHQAGNGMEKLIRAMQT